MGKEYLSESAVFTCPLGMRFKAIETANLKVKFKGQKLLTTVAILKPNQSPIPCSFLPPTPTGAPTPCPCIASPLVDNVIHRSMANLLTVNAKSTCTAGQFIKPQQSGTNNHVVTGSAISAQVASINFPKNDTPKQSVKIESAQNQSIQTQSAQSNQRSQSNQSITSNELSKSKDINSINSEKNIASTTQSETLSQSEVLSQSEKSSEILREYFYKMTTDKNLKDLVKIDEEILKLSSACKSSLFKCLDHKPMTVSLAEDSGSIFPDFLYSDGIPLISPKFKRILDSQGVDNLFYKPIYLEDATLGIHEPYILALPPRIIAESGTARCKINSSAVGNYQIFKLADVWNFDIIVTKNLMEVISKFTMTNMLFSKIEED